MKRNNIAIATMISAIILAIFVLGMLTEKNINHQTKYEYYTKNGEKGTTYKCEFKESAKCEVDGNMIEVSQFSEVEK